MESSPSALHPDLSVEEAQDVLPGNSGFYISVSQPVASSLEWFQGCLSKLMFDFGNVVIELSLMTGDSQNILYNL